MSDIVLGQLITGPAERDAIHIAVAPVVAACKLSPGEEVGFLEDGTVGAVEKPIGIVDPFLKRMVNKGEQFYLVLFQNTVTGMMHHWSHPAFTDTYSAEKSDKKASELWLRQFAEKIKQTYEQLIEALTDYENSGTYTYDNSESYKEADYDLLPEMWKHFEVVTGIKATEKDAMPFTCSC